MLVSDLLIKIGVNADLKELAKVDKSIKGVAKGVGILGAAIGAAVGGLVAFTAQALTGLDEIAQLSRVTGESSKNIQQLGTIAETAGSSVQAANASIEGLSRTIGEAVNGVGLGAKAFENYGLSARKANGDIKSATELMEDLRAKMRGMSEQSQIAMLAKLGIDKTMIQMLRMTNEEMAEARANAEAMTLGTGSQANVDEAAAFQDALTELAQAGKAVAEFIALNLSPVLRELMGIFKEWFIANNDGVKDGLMLVAGALAGVLKFVGLFIKSVDTAISSTVGWKFAFAALGVAIATSFAPAIKAFLIANGVILGIGAAIATVVFLFDDLITEMQGGESFLGEYWQPVIKGIKLVQKGFDALKEAFKVLEPTFKATQKVIEDVWGVIKALFKGDTKEITEQLDKFGDDVGKMFEEVGKLITQPFEAAFKWIGDQFDKLVKPVLDGIKSAGEHFGFSSEEKSEDEIRANIQKGAQEFDKSQKEKQRGAAWGGFKNMLGLSSKEVENNSETNNFKEIERETNNFKEVIKVPTIIEAAANGARELEKMPAPEVVAQMPAQAVKNSNKVENKTDARKYDTHITVNAQSNDGQTIGKAVADTVTTQMATLQSPVLA